MVFHRSQQHESKFSNKKALITGASSGIGEATAIRFAQKGIHVILTARRLERLQKLQESISAAGGKATIIKADLSIEADRVKLFNSLQETQQLPDILLNNAGLAWYGYFQEMPWPIAKNTINLNVEALTHLTTLFLPNMLKNHYGRIINIGSIAGKLPEQGVAVYSATKAYVDAFTKSARRDLKRSGVSVSVVRAGPVKTEFFDTARKLENGGSVPFEQFAISVDRVVNAICRTLNHPRRFVYVPRYMIVSPLLEFLLAPVLDLVGPALLAARKKE